MPHVQLVPDPIPTIVHKVARAVPTAVAGAAATGSLTTVPNPRAAKGRIAIVNPVAESLQELLVSTGKYIRESANTNTNMIRLLGNIAQYYTRLGYGKRADSVQQNLKAIKQHKTIDWQATTELLQQFKASIWHKSQADKENSILGFMVVDRLKTVIKNCKLNIDTVKPSSRQSSKTSTKPRVPTVAVCCPIVVVAPWLGDKYKQNAKHEAKYSQRSTRVPKQVAVFRVNDSVHRVVDTTTSILPRRHQVRVKDLTVKYMLPSD